ncbi:MAG: UDP-N-acetylmuramoyl-L-alanyl-D-glutamate--2,6-diaminopimelate ligase [Bacillota bacterium]|nr:UDP-N-acetylmuramoyl-L-alanyl-D-glutamate--2,6-diaminopimelate ligase [Bacillota bacterium]
MNEREAERRRRTSEAAARFWGYPSRDMTVFGVTGTNGKTTVSYFLKSILEEARGPCGLLGTIEYRFGDQAERARLTTPDSIELQRWLARMKDRGMRQCVMEVSSHALALERVAHVDISYGIFTNLSRDHLDFHQDTEEYYQTKKRLFHMVKKASVINIDDDGGRRLHKELRESKIVALSCSLEDEEADYFGEGAESGSRGSRFLLRRQGEALGEMTTALPGSYNASNALMAAACALEAGVSFREAAAGAAGLRGVPGRLEPVENSLGAKVYVDFAHTPDALEKVLTALRELNEGRLLCVFGCGGDRDRSKRREMGRVAGRLCDFCVVTDDNPRTEAPEQIAGEAAAGLAETGTAYEVVHDRREAIRRAMKECRRGDVLLIAGKGHEEYQIIGKEKRPFSDRGTVLELLKESGKEAWKS